jgi:hypothetical protein
LSTFSTASATARTVHVISGSALTGSWNIVHGTFGSSLAALYVNGLGVAYGPTTGSLTGYNASNQLYAGASYGSDTGFYTGSIANISVNNADLDGLTVNKNYNAFASRFGLPVRRSTITDPDALLFVEAAGLTDETQILAINSLVLGLKSNNLWTKMQAVYPFVGGTAYSHKWNLKDPRNTDAAFRLQYFGTVIHSNLGISNQFGGGGAGSGYANTYYFPLTSNINVSTSIHLSMYSTSPNTETFPGTVMGNAGNASGLSITPNYRNFGTSYYQLYFAGSGGWLSLGGAGSTNVGFYMASRTSLNDVAFYRRINTGNSSTSATAPYLAGTNGFVKILSAAFIQWTGNIGFATLGFGLSATDAVNLDTVISSYQTALGRKPF